MAIDVLNPEVKKWREQITAALKREKNFRKDGRRINEIYEAEKKDENPFNILYSNTETLLPALYNNLPRPVVDRRFKDADALGRLAAKTTERTLAFLLDSNDGDASDFDDMLKKAVLEALLPGRGVTRFKYDATFEKIPDAVLPTMGGEEGEEVAEAAPVERIAKETVCGEEVPWDRVLFGYAKRWKDVPWVAFEHFMDKDELRENFGDKGASIPTSKVGPEGAEDDEKTRDKDSEGEELAHVWEIWDKRSRKVVFLADGYSDVVKKVDDPLKLSGFFPLPRPLTFFAKVSNLCPKALYAMYENQAAELNTITKRIDAIVRALKVRGFYDSTLEGLDQLLSQPDNTLMPAENVSAMLQGQTLEKAIWLMPIERLVTVLQQLYLQREQVKQVIYEISGIADVMRGASKASETLGAQKLKSDWGSLRLKRAQKEVQRYVRDCLRIMAEIALTKLQPQTIASMTGLKFPYAADKQQAQMVAQQMSMMQQEPPPDVMQTLQAPAWEDILGVLQNDLQRNFCIDIETNSTVDIEATEDKEQIGEFMNAMAQFMNGIMPAIQSGYMSFDAAKAMLLSISRRFRFGTEVEDQINSMQAPPPQGEEEKAAEKEKAGMEMEMLREKAKIDKERMMLEAQLAKEELEIKRAEMQMKHADMQRKQEFMAAQHQQKMQAMMVQHATRQQGESNANV